MSDKKKIKSSSIKTKKDVEELLESGAEIEFMKILDSPLFNEVKRLSGVLNDVGDACDYGISIDEFEEIYETWRKKTDKNVTAVSGWCWWDLEIPEGIDVPEGSLPAVVKAECILATIHPGFELGNWVRTTLLQKLHDNCVFETKNTCYILVGQGTRKTVDAKSAYTFF
ncbi:DUF6957 family protein [Dasania marina]|uniref:DUF6957 family protein n=1 Tax=Dasania marina TaxID=471499 RepID=UPI000685362B|nr:hypothetical protein [Dasania marina]